MTDSKDANGNILEDGDSISIVKDLKVKGAGKTLKRGTIMKNITLTNKPTEIEVGSGKSTFVLKTEFVKKV